MDKNPLVKKMGQEVFDLFLSPEKEEFFPNAFDYAFKRTVAPRNKIYYSDSKGSYSYFFEATKKEVKSLIKKHNQENERLAQGKIRVPALQPKTLRYHF